MSRPRRAVRTAIQTWLNTLTWTTTPTIVVEPPEPGATVDLPTLSLRMGSVSRHRQDIAEVIAEDAAQTIYDAGNEECAGAFIVECTSEADAESFEEELRTQFFLESIDSDDAENEVLHLDATFYGETVDVVLERDDEAATVIEDSDQTQMTNLWRLTYPLTIRWPLYYRRPEAIGDMNIVGSLAEDPDGVPIADTDFDLDLDVDPYDTNNHAPAAALDPIRP
jgi:hypothetical protein